MDIIQKILSYFSQIPVQYRKSIEFYSGIESIYNTLVRGFDCEIFHPSSYDIIEKARTENPTLYFQIIQDLEPLQYDIAFNDFFEDISNYNLRTQEYNNFLNSDIETTVENLLKSKLYVDPCEIKNADKISAEEFKNLAETYRKENFSKDEKFQEFIEKCTLKNNINFTEKDLIEDSELQKAILNCFISDEESNPLELDSVPNAFENLSESQFLENESSLNLENSLGQENLLNLLSLLGKQSPCLEGVLGKIDDIKEVSKVYASHISKKTEVEKKYAYSKVHFEMYNQFFKSLKNDKVAIPSSKRELKTNELKEYSKEIVFIKNNKFSGLFNVYDLSIREKKKLTEKDGSYFKSYFEIDKKFKKIAKSKITEEQATSIEKEIKIKFENTLNAAIKDIRENVSTLSGRIRANVLLNYPVNGNSIISSEIKRLQPFFDQIKEEYLRTEDEYLNFNEKSKEYEKELERLSLEIEVIAETSGCTENKNFSSITNSIEPYSGGESGDFRGIPDPNKPNMYDKKYWERFVGMANIINLFPVPQFSVSNRTTVNLTDPQNPEVKIPVGVPVFDDDGIPRFLFYPIGLIIPTPVSADFIYRIPLPMVWKVLSVFTIESPLKLLMEKLLEFQSLLSGLNEYEKYLTPDFNINRLWRELPLGLVLSILAILAIDQSLPIQKINEEIAKVSSIIAGILRGYIEEAILEVDHTFDLGSVSDYLKILGRRIDDKINLNIFDIENRINFELSKIGEAIGLELGQIDFSNLGRDLEAWLSSVNDFINTAKSILASVDSCLNTNYSGMFNFTFDNIMFDIQKYGGQNLRLLDGLQLPEFRFPYFRFSEYFTFTLENLKFESLTDLRAWLKDLDLNTIMFNLPNLVIELKDFLYNYYLKLLKFKLWESGLNIKPLFSLKIPNDLIQSLSLVLFDFPELLFVVLLGQSGVIPYPFVLLINPSQNNVPGIIDSRTIQFLITLDITNPIKIVKRNFGSYVLPLKNIIDDFINSGFGIHFDPVTNNFLNVCGLLESIGFTWQDILANLQRFFKFNFKLPDLWNPFELPNPDILCKLVSAKDSKEVLKEFLYSSRVNTSNISGEFGKLSGFTKYGITDLNGSTELIIDEFKQIYGNVKFPSLDDVLNFGQSRRDLLLFDQFGITKKVKIDILPQLTIKSPYLQDDLPSWERLQWWNIPFILFLIEFNIAAKFGAVLPIPEVSPIAKMR